MKRADSTGTSAGQVSRERLSPTVAVLAIEQVLADLGIHARLSEIVAKAQSIENGIMPSRSRRKREHAC
jgi:hypothetical protein